MASKFFLSRNVRKCNGHRPPNEPACIQIRLKTHLAQRAFKVVEIKLPHGSFALARCV